MLEQRCKEPGKILLKFSIYYFVSAFELGEGKRKRVICDIIPLFIYSLIQKGFMEQELGIAYYPSCHQFTWESFIPSQ